MKNRLNLMNYKDLLEDDLSSKWKLNVLFCILQGRNMKCNQINTMLYEVQNSLLGCNDFLQIKKGFVYSFDRIGIRSFEDTNIEDIYYVLYPDYIEGKEKLLLVSDALLRNSIEKKPDEHHVLLILADFSDTANAFRLSEIDILKLTYEQVNPNYDIIYIHSGKDVSSFPNLIRKYHGEIYSFDEVLGDSKILLRKLRG